MVITKNQLKSMTAYGRGVSLSSHGRLVIEIQSVNRRFLEINVSLPRLFLRYEVDIRKQVAACIGRGMLNLSVSWKQEGVHSISVIPNLALAHGLKKAWEQLATELKLKNTFPLELLIQERELFSYEEEMLHEDIYQTALNQALQEALENLLTMKKEEGEILKSDLRARLKKLTEEINHIQSLSQSAPEKYRQKLTDRLQELFRGSIENEERILREIAIYAERIDSSEEVVRFKAHLEQFEHILENTVQNEKETRGKIFDFLLQELLREINTLGTKAADLAITQHVVIIKSELEKIREQVQNIE